MGLSDLLELCLNLTDCVVLELFDFLEGAADHAHCLWVDSSRGKDLVDLSILGLKTFLDGLKLLLEDQIAETCLLMKFINNLVELCKQLLLFGFEVLELLELDFVLPFLFLVLFCGLTDFLLDLD